MITHLRDSYEPRSSLNTVGRATPNGRLHGHGTRQRLKHSLTAPAPAKYRHGHRHRHLAGAAQAQAVRVLDELLREQTTTVEVTPKYG